MLLRYARMAQGNFGDDVNVELWPELFPDLADRHPDAHLYGVGTLLGARAPTDRRSCWGPAVVIVAHPHWTTAGACTGCVDRGPARRDAQQAAMRERCAQFAKDYRLTFAG